MKYEQPRTKHGIYILAGSKGSLPNTTFMVFWSLEKQDRNSGNKYYYWIGKQINGFWIVGSTTDGNFQSQTICSQLHFQFVNWMHYVYTNLMYCCVDIELCQCWTSDNLWPVQIQNNTQQPTLRGQDFRT